MIFDLSLSYLTSQPILGTSNLSIIDAFISSTAGPWMIYDLSCKEPHLQDVIFFGLYLKTVTDNNGTIVSLILVIHKSNMQLISIGNSRRNTICLHEPNNH